MSSSNRGGDNYDVEAQRAAFARYAQIKEDERLARTLSISGSLPPPAVSVASVNRNVPPSSNISSSSNSVRVNPPVLFGVYPQIFSAPIVASKPREFTTDEIKKITAHFESLKTRPNGDHLQKLMQAVLEDDLVNLEFVKNPVFIRGDGQVLDKEVALDMIQRAIKSPKAQLDFDDKDIIPCRPVIQCMKELLNIISNKAPASDDLVVDPNVAVAYKKLSSLHLKAINSYYMTLTLQQKRLFNIVCRGKNGHILEDPVLMIDGCLYERSMVEAACAARDLTPCYFSRAVIDLVIEMIEMQFEKIAQQQAAANNNSVPQVGASDQAVSLPNPKSPELEINLLQVGRKPLAEEKLSIERDDLITEIKNLINNFKSQSASYDIAGQAEGSVAANIKISKPELINHDMIRMLEQSIYALEQLNVDYIENARTHYPNFSNVKTVAGSLFGSGPTSLYKSAYAQFASSMGSVADQPGWHVYNLVGRVEEAINHINQERNVLARVSMGNRK